MSIRITISRRSVKDLTQKLKIAYSRGDIRLVRRISALLQVLDGEHEVSQVSETWGISDSCIYEWIQEFMLGGIKSLKYQRKAGRHSKLSASQKQQLCQWLDASPLSVGFEYGCTPSKGCFWNALLVQELIRQKFGVLYNRMYAKGTFSVCALLKGLGYTFQKAKFVSDHIDEAKRGTWRKEIWPKILSDATRCRRAARKWPF